MTRRIKEWIRFEIEGKIFTKCPYCEWQFPQVVNSKWCPICDRPVALTRGMPYRNYIPTSPHDAKTVRSMKLLLKKGLDIL